ncbi:MAG: hypothetical protein JWR09_1683, partial [Mucilaginibacter sp.]|nr:hypothetical protein [Mucilaginibacter sp.]
MKIIRLTSERSQTGTLLAIILILLAFVNNAYSQAEVEPWGNITGIRKQGQLFDFESSIKVVSTDRKHVAITAKEKQSPHYKRVADDEQEVTTWIDSLFFKENVKDNGAGKIRVTIQLTSHKDTVLKGVYFCVTLPNEYLNADLRYS